VTDVDTRGAAIGAHHDTVAAVRTRLAAWLVTGPLGHLWAGAADWAALLARLSLARARRLLRRP
jgi:hypothetical protein